MSQSECQPGPLLPRLCFISADVDDRGPVVLTWRTSSHLRRAGALGIAGGVLTLAIAAAVLADQRPTHSHLHANSVTTQTSVQSVTRPPQETHPAPAPPAPTTSVRLPGRVATSAFKPARRAHTTLQLLWPFTSEAAVLEWETAYRTGGHQPWHASPCDTASLFVEAVLHQPTPVEDSCTIRGDQARVQLRQAGQPPATRTVTIIRLLRIGVDPGGWVVVGPPAAE